MADTIPIPGKKKHVRKPEAETDPEFQIAPMIDILLVLLVFFMSISTTEDLQQNQNVHLPVAKEAKESKPSPGQCVVNVLFNEINHTASIDVDGAESNLNDLSNILARRVAKNPQMRVFLRVDKNVVYAFTR